MCVYMCVFALTHARVSISTNAMFIQNLLDILQYSFFEPLGYRYINKCTAIPVDKHKHEGIPTTHKRMNVFENSVFVCEYSHRFLLCSFEYISPLRPYSWTYRKTCFVSELLDSNAHWNLTCPKAFVSQTGSDSNNTGPFHFKCPCLKCPSCNQ